MAEGPAAAVCVTATTATITMTTMPVAEELVALGPAAAAAVVVVVATAAAVVDETTTALVESIATLPVMTGAMAMAVVAAVVVDVTTTVLRAENALRLLLVVKEATAMLLRPASTRVEAGPTTIVNKSGTERRRVLPLV